MSTKEAAARVARYQREYVDMHVCANRDCPIPAPALPEQSKIAQGVTTDNALQCIATGEFAEADNWIALGTLLSYKYRKHDR